ncbi:AraC family transcriptional regulator [Gramella sp. AN32]|uniref:Helix-turn-helix domain-containing protein n=1 Tax=Christiangramia antarctica TaxID=2058158 RepID=A0ABW5X5A8_9FLAO|nr:AraC family transcriptional regulator [Gramella sp. AN32]MCM4156631.1 hypothetical protein [Gramella sp. AN32]
MIVEVFVKNMVCDRCIKVVTNELVEEGVAVQEVELGKVVYKTENKEEDQLKLTKVLEQNSFEEIQGSDQILVEQVKLCLIKLLQKLPIEKEGTLSNYLSEEIHYKYSSLSRVFSYTENITIEKYFIRLKIEKVKELIQSKQYNFTQISQLLDYSNVNHLSRQFKTETGMNLSEYKTLEQNFRNSLDRIL